MIVVAFFVLFVPFVAKLFGHERRENHEMFEQEEAEGLARP